MPWTEEPGGLQSMGSQRVGLDLATEQQQKFTVNLEKHVKLYHEDRTSQIKTVSKSKSTIYTL